MAKKFKDYYGIECADVLALKFKKVYKSFDSENFIKEIKLKTKNLEMFNRLDVFVLAFDKYLPKKFENKIKIFKKVLGPELKTDTGMFIFGWFLWPISRYLEKRGTENVKISIDFIYELTKRFTGEFAIRPVLEKEPKNVLKVLEKWSRDKSVHVRRLSSEAVRPRLPWAKKNNIFIKNFDICFKIPDNLKNSKEKFVQKSVANNLNDLSKENRELYNKIIKKWSKNPSKETAWIIKHGSRTIRKNMI